jgi:outer membrane protein assembly factor BamE
MSRPALTAGLCALSLLGGCASSFKGAESLFGLITPYRFEIVQGNALTKEQIERIQPGMTRLQVRDVLGSPMVADLFHAERWDYPFIIRRQGAEPQRRNVTVTFEGDRLVKVDAPELPSEKDFVASISRPREIQPRKLTLTPEERSALPVPPALPAPAVEPSGPVRTYPPLEAS